MKFFFVYLLFITIPIISISQEFQSAKEKNKFKPTLFHNYSDTTDTNLGLFEFIETFNLGDEVNLPITPQMNFKGKVNILHQTSDYRTLSIESRETPGLRLIISHTSEDKYYGIIGCVKHKDVLVLEHNQKNDKYVWIKREIADKIPD
jgi:hypothetical protein